MNQWIKEGIKKGRNKERRKERKKEKGRKEALKPNDDKYIQKQRTRKTCKTINKSSNASRWSEPHRVAKAWRSWQSASDKLG